MFDLAEDLIVANKTSIHKVGLLKGDSTKSHWRGRQVSTRSCQVKGLGDVREGRSVYGENKGSKKTKTIVRF